jgi:hypothetical protein
MPCALGVGRWGLINEESAPMLNIGLLLLWMSFDGKKSAIRFVENRMADFLAKANLDGK